MPKTKKPKPKKRPRPYLTEDEILAEMRQGISEAITDQNADAVKLLSQAYAEVRALQVGRVGY